MEGTIVSPTFWMYTQAPVGKLYVNRMRSPVRFSVTEPWACSRTSARGAHVGAGAGAGKGLDGGLFWEPLGLGQ